MDTNVPNQEKVEIVPYNAAWRTQFKRAENDLKQLLGCYAKDIQHIGSTSVNNLASKNRIDIQIGVTAITKSMLTNLNSRLVKFGFPPAFLSVDHLPPNENNKQEWEKIYLRGLSTKWDFRANIHFRKVGAKNYEYAILFRDYLRAHPEAATSYACVKERLSHYTKYDRQAYSDIKDPVCDLIMINARKWQVRKLSAT